MDLSSKHLQLESLISTLQHRIAGINLQGMISSTSTLSQLATHGIPSVVAFIWQQLTFSFVWKAVLLIFIAFNLKNFPLIYHLRILNGVRFVLKSQRPQQDLTPDQLFQPLITSSRAPLMEIDVFGHKSNSTYFSDVDIARTHFALTVFSKAIEKMRGGTTMNGLSGKARSAFTMPLGAVSCCFKRELKPYEKYDIWTRILSWDQKWFYLVTHFVKHGHKIEPTEHSMYPRQDAGSRRGSTDQEMNGAICASALSKVVFKNGRITIAPEVMLELAGLLPAKATESEGKTAELEHAQAKGNKVDSLPNKPAVEVVQNLEGLDTDSGYDGSRDGSVNEAQVTWTRERIEQERLRGMEIASTLAAQSKLEEEFTGSEGPALGRHYDGHGIEGVVSTLAQLGKLSNYQLL